MTAELPELSAVRDDSNPLRPGITLPELIRLCDSWAAEGVTPPLREDWLVEAAGPVRGRALMAGAILLLLTRDDARLAGATVAELFYCLLAVVSSLVWLLGLVVDAIPSGAAFGAACAFFIAAGISWGLRELAGGELW